MEEALKFSDLPESHQKLAICFAKSFYIPCTAVLRYRDSYALKHDLQSMCGLYMSNDQFKDMMQNYVGLKPVNPGGENWYFKIRKRESNIARLFNHSSPSGNILDCDLDRNDIKKLETAFSHVKDYMQHFVDATSGSHLFDHLVDKFVTPVFKKIEAKHKKD